MEHRDRVGRASLHPSQSVFNSDAAAASGIKSNARRFRFPTTSPKVSNAALTMNCWRSCTFPAARQAKSDQCYACSNESPRFRSLVNEIKALKRKAESCSRQLKAWAQSLQDSEFKGERHVNVKTKRADQAVREREEFLKELAEIREKGAAPKKT